ncbi:nuclear transport factor 2 family protein [Prosthecodimorpha staleyi]|uniref:Nuclear transport factor 2 family protein n=1 Tax=Prosthecodimorpha staleyi TaxID=2840188 RepID=A0A947D5X5_9HYPH|nr:nuclear transport factor 2 family protein [Prosthecodimorpha staleyi]MBT9291645.1 nuclear transport factor 2 family protein [Prosthecodimorpha staleyi]
MSDSLPNSVKAYFSGKNARDLSVAVSGFAETAIVNDEGRDHTGPAAIRTWIAETIAKYDDRATVRRSATRENRVDVVAEVSGAFPGSPILLRFGFTMKADRIVRLEIAP